MPAQGRKNVHGKTGVRFKAAYTASKNYSMLLSPTSQAALLLLRRQQRLRHQFNNDTFA